MTRERLPDRRPSESEDLFFEGNRYHISIGYYPDGRIGEVFTHGAKIGSEMDRLLDDTCVVFSLLLQHGVRPDDIAGSMGRRRSGPASIIGAVADLLVRSGDMIPQVDERNEPAGA